MRDLAAADAVELSLASSRAGCGRDSRPTPVASPLRRARPMRAIIVWLLPEPDSPTIATVSPRADMRGRCPCTASTVAVERAKAHVQVADASSDAARPSAAAQRSFGSSASRRPSPRKLKREQRQRPGRSTGKISSHGAASMFCAPSEISAPQRGHRRLHAEAEEGEEALEQDDLRDRQRHVDDDRPEQVGHDVAADDPRVGRRPAPRAASTNSCCLSDSVWPRTMRAMVEPLAPRRWRRTSG